MTTIIRAENLALSAGRGTVYGPLELSTDAPFTVITGGRGSGKTCLLLTFAGRMKPGTGTVKVLGHGGVSRLQSQSAIAGFHGIDDLEESVTVGDAITERLRWNAPWYSRIRAADDAVVTRVLAPVFGALPIPAAHAMIWDLDEDAKLLLRIGLALVDDPKILFVDNIDHVHDLRAQTEVIARLGALTEAGIAVVVSAAAYEPALYSQVATEIQVVALSQEQLV